MTTDRDRLAADLSKNTPLGAQGVTDWRPAADRLIALGWTRLDEERLARALHAVEVPDEIADGDHWPDSEWCIDIEHEWAAAIAKAYREDTDDDN